MSDQMFDFDTSKERRQVEEFDRALDRMMSNVERLNKTDVNRFSRQFEEMSRGNTAAARQVTDAARKMVQDMEALVRLSGAKMKSLSDLGPIQALVNSIKNGKGELQAVLKVALAEMQGQMEMNNRAMVAEATRTAKNVGAAFSDIKSQLGKNLYSDSSYKQFFAGFSANMGGSKGEITKAAKDSAAVFTSVFAAEAGRGRELFANFDRSLGLAKGSVAKSAKDSADVFSAAFATEVAKNRQMWSGFEQSLGMNREAIRKSAKDSAAVFAQAYSTELAKTKQMLNNFEQSLGIGSKAKSARSSASVFMDAGMMPKAEEVDKLSASFKRLTADGNDVHSMARGLASGFGALWLTWGNLVPLFIGAGISNGFMQTAKTGMQVAHTMAIIENIGGNTTKEMVALNAEMDRMGMSGPKGPIAIAEAMQVLSLAGLKANDILRVTQDVLNFSVAGTTDLKTAADTLVSISTAFDMGSSGFGRVADVVSKAAAESKTSVESFSNAMKTASVIHKQYGVSLEDTATALAAMSQLGIEGTAAGTALRNMYADLSGRSEKVAKILRAQGIEMRMANGQFRPMIETVAMLNDKFRSLDGISQKNLMQALLSERGAKGIIEMMDLIGKSAVGMSGNVTNALVVLNENITNSYGFAAINAAKMAQTAQSQFEAVKATLQTSLNEAYRTMEPQLLLIFDAMKKAFGSPEFIAGVVALIDVVSRFALVIAENLNVIVAYAATLATLKIAQMGLVATATALTTAEALMTKTRVAGIAATDASTVATTANAAAQARAAGAAASTAGTLGIFARLLPGIGTAVTVLAGAWMAYEFWQSKSNNAAKASADLYVNNVAKTLTDQAAKLREINNLRISGLTLTEAQARVDSRNQAKAAADPYDQKVNAAIRNQADLQVELDKREKFAKATGNGVDAKRRVAEQKARVEAAGLAVTAAKMEEREAKTRVDAAAADVAAETKRQAELDRLDAAKRQKELESQFGSGKFQIGDDKAAKTKKAQFQVARSNEIAELEKTANARLSTMQNAYDNEKRLLDARHQAGLVTEGEYQARSFSATREYEKNYIEAIRANNASYAEVYNERYAEIDKVRKAAEKAGDTDAVKRLDQELENLSNAKKAYTDVNVEKVAKMEADAFQRLTLASIKAEGAIKKLIDSDREFWNNDREDVNKEKNLAAMNAQWRNMNESVFSFDTAMKAGMTAAAAETAKFTARLEEIDRGYKLAENAAVDFMMANISALASGDKEATATYEGLLRVADAWKKVKEDNIQKAQESVMERSMLALENARAEQLRTFTNSLSDAVYTAIFEGGKAGGKKMRDVLQQELLRKPLMAVIQGVMGSIVGSIMGMLGGGGAAGGAGGGFGGVLNLLSMGKNAYGMVSGGFGGMSMGNMVGTQFANATGTGIDGLLMSNGAYGTAGGAGGSLMGAGVFTAVAAVVLNALGAFRSERKVGGGLRGTLGAGKGGIKPWEEWREGGTLFSGPEYSTFDPLEELRSKRKKLQDLRDSGQGATQQAATLQTIVDNLEAQYGDLEGQVSKQADILDKAFEAMRTNVMDMGKVLGLSTDALKGFTTQLGGDKGLNFEGLKDEEIQAKISEALATANNDLAQQIIGRWETITTRKVRVNGTNVGSQGEDASIIYEETEEFLTTTRYIASEFARDGEKAIDTLTRLATSLSTVNSTFEMLGYTLLEASLKGGDLASKIIDAFGSVEAFTSATTYFFENYYSDAEKQAARQRQIDKAFAGKGIATPKTMEDYRKLVEAQDLTTEEGRKMYAFLLQLAPTFKEIADGAKDVVEAAREAAEDRLSKAADALRKAYRAALDNLQNQIDAAQTTFNSLNGIVQLLKDNIRELYNEVEVTAGLSAAQGQQYITAALASLRANGTVPDEAKLRESIGAVRTNFNNTTYGSQFEEDNARLVLAGELSQMYGVLQPQLTAAEQTLVQLQDQYKLMEKELAMWEVQLEMLDDNYVATVDIATAIREFKDAWAALDKLKNPTKNPTTGGPTFGGGGATFGPGGATPAAPPSKYSQVTSLGTAGTAYIPITDSERIAKLDSIYDAYHKYDGTGNAEGLLKDMIAAGATAKDLSGLSGYYENDWVKFAEQYGYKLPAYASGGMHSGGLRVVGERGWEIEATGASRIWNQDQLAQALVGSESGSSYDVEIVTQLRNIHITNVAMLQELTTLRKLHQSWDGDGLPQERAETTVPTP